jgi:hypothetical protein
MQVTTVGRRYATAGILVGLALAAHGCSNCCFAESEIVYPTSSFMTRSIGPANVLVGDASGKEGTVWQSSFLEVKEGTSDRVVVEYYLGGRTVTETALLDIKLANSGAPAFTPIYLYSFEGNGLANAADYFKTDNLIMEFTDNGLASTSAPPHYMPFTLDITSAYNAAITAGDEFLGLLFRNVADGPQYTHYLLTEAPALRLGVPEPSCLTLAAIAAAGVCIRRRRAR